MPKIREVKALGLTTREGRCTGRWTDLAEEVSYLAIIGHLLAGAVYELMEELPIPRRCAFQ